MEPSFYNNGNPRLPKSDLTKYNVFKQEITVNTLEYFD